MTALWRKRQGKSYILGSDTNINYIFTLMCSMQEALLQTNQFFKVRIETRSFEWRTKLSK